MRDLTTDERGVLAHVVLDPDAWWTHCQAAFKGDPEVALAGKIAQHRPAYAAATARGGYRTRAKREA